jgi:predicted Rossmann fold flavoprotein
MSNGRVIVAGGGAAGFFAAIACAEAQPGWEVVLLERAPEFLSKVRISGGGRCNVTHACFDPRELAQSYPRGGRALIGPFARFQPRDTMAWFQNRGVSLKIESDGRVFPTSDSSQTIIHCLLHAARTAGVRAQTGCGLAQVTPNPTGGFHLTLTDGTNLQCDRLLLAIGGCRAAAAGHLATSLGHSLEPPVPSLFTFTIQTPWLRTLAGVTVKTVGVSVPGLRLRDQGPLLVTHWGLSGPAILRLSASGARVMHTAQYRFALRLNWLPQLDRTSIDQEFRHRRQRSPARWVSNLPVHGLPARLWEQLVQASGIGRETRWADLSRTASHRLVDQLTRTELPVTGKSLNRDEFVTCGGVRLAEVDFRTMESRVCPGLHLAGELLDVDGLTGGFNFQAAWTTGWLAGQAIATSASTKPTSSRNNPLPSDSTPS